MANIGMPKLNIQEKKAPNSSPSKNLSQAPRATGGTFSSRNTSIFGSKTGQLSQTNYGITADRDNNFAGKAANANVNMQKLLGSLFDKDFVNFYHERGHKSAQSDGMDSFTKTMMYMQLASVVAEGLSGIAGAFKSDGASKAKKPLKAEKKAETPKAEPKKEVNTSPTVKDGKGGAVNPQGVAPAGQGEPVNNSTNVITDMQNAGDAQTLQNAINTAKGQQSTLGNQINTLNIEIEELNKQTSDLERKVADANEALKANTEGIATCDAEIKKSNNLLGPAEARFRNAEAQLTGLNESNPNYRTLLENYNNALSNLNAIKNRIKAQEDKKAELEAQTNNLQKAAEDADKALTDHNKAITDKKAKLGELQSQKKALDTEISQQEERLKQMKQGGSRDETPPVQLKEDIHQGVSATAFNAQPNSYNQILPGTYDVEGSTITVRKNNLGQNEYINANGRPMNADVAQTLLKGKTPSFKPNLSFTANKQTQSSFAQNSLSSANAANNTALPQRFESGPAAKARELGTTEDALANKGIIVNFDSSTSTYRCYQNGKYIPDENVKLMLGIMSN